MRNGEGVGGSSGLGAEVAVEEANTSQHVDRLDDGSSVFGLPDCQVVPVQGLADCWVRRCYLQGVGARGRHGPEGLVGFGALVDREGGAHRQRLVVYIAPRAGEQSHLKGLGVGRGNQVGEIEPDVDDFSLGEGGQGEAGQGVGVGRGYEETRVGGRRIDRVYEGVSTPAAGLENTPRIGES